MRKRGLICFLLLLLLPVLAVSARADIGPKPSVVVDFEGLEEETYYVTLLSEQFGTGPWEADRAYEDWCGPEPIWEAFRSYSDPDGLYFLGCFADCSETDRFEWNYYPPERFKILVYFPTYERFLVSEERYERYAFDSYYTVDVSGLEIRSVQTLSAQADITKSYNWKRELPSLLCRILATIALELAVAWLFRFRSRRQVRVIAVTNIVTQTVLNVLLNVINYKYGGLAFVFHYLWMEVVVFLIEGIVYTRTLRDNRAKTALPWLYALAANLVSFAAGMQLAQWIPGIF